MKVSLESNHRTPNAVLARRDQPHPPPGTASMATRVASPPVSWNKSTVCARYPSLTSLLCVRPGITPFLAYHASTAVARLNCSVSHDPGASANGSGYAEYSTCTTGRRVKAVTPNANAAPAMNGQTQNGRRKGARRDAVVCSISDPSSVGCELEIGNVASMSVTTYRRVSSGS